MAIPQGMMPTNVSGKPESSFWGGTPSGVMQSTGFGSGQLNKMDILANLGLTGYQDLAKNKFDFAPIEAKARRDFTQKTIPSIAERFASLGTGGSQRSSAFPKLLSQAGGDLETNLAAMGSDYAMRGQALNQGLFGSMLGMGLTPPWQHDYIKSQPGMLEQAGSSFMENIGPYLKYLLMLLA